MKYYRYVLLDNVSEDYFSTPTLRFKSLSDLARYVVANGGPPKSPNASLRVLWADERDLKDTAHKVYGRAIDRPSVEGWEVVPKEEWLPFLVEAKLLEDE